MHDYEQVKAIAIITAGACGLAFIIYNFILSCRETDSYLQVEEINIKEFDNEDDSRGRDKFCVLLRSCYAVTVIL